MNCVHFETFFFAFHPSTHPWNFAKVQPRQWDGTWLHRGSSTTGALSSWKIILGAEKWCKLDQSCVILIYHICLCLSTNHEIFSQQKFAWAKVFWDTTAVDILWNMTRHMQMCPTMTHSKYANKDSYFKPKSYLSCTPIHSWANAFQQSCNVVSTNEITGIYFFLTWGVSVLPIFCNYLWVHIEICVHLQTYNENIISIKAVLPRGAIVRIASTLQLNPVGICEDIALGSVSWPKHREHRRSTLHFRLRKKVNFFDLFSRGEFDRPTYLVLLLDMTLQGWTFPASASQCVIPEWDSLGMANKTM